MKTFWQWLLGSPEQRLDNRPNGYALCVGLNRVDPNFYEGWSGELNACENDATALAHFLESKGFHTSKLLTTAATRDSVLRKIQELGTLANPGDIIVVTNSSHGGQVPDYDGTEADGMDETICMFDGQIIDDELEAAWSRFASGVRVLFVSDSCHSGTVAREAFSAHDRLLNTHPGSRAMPHATQAAIIQAQPLTLRKRKREASTSRQRKDIAASLLAFGACQDNQTAADGPVNGAFTGALLDTLRRYSSESYGRIITQVRRALPPTQTPSYTYAGPRSARFENSVAFSI